MIKWIRDLWKINYSLGASPTKPERLPDKYMDVPNFSFGGRNVVVRPLPDKKTADLIFYPGIEVKATVSPVIGGYGWNISMNGFEWGDGHPTGRSTLRAFATIDEAKQDLFTNYLTSVKSIFENRVW